MLEEKHFTSYKMLLQSTLKNTKKNTQHKMAAKLNLSKSKNTTAAKKNPQKPQTNEKNLNSFQLKYFSGILAVVHCRGSGLETFLVKHALSTQRNRNLKKSIMQVLYQHI